MSWVGGGGRNARGARPYCNPLIKSGHPLARATRGELHTGIIIIIIITPRAPKYRHNGARGKTARGCVNCARHAVQCGDLRRYAVVRVAFSTRLFVEI